jgi:hypothetical protein
VESRQAQPSPVTGDRLLKKRNGRVALELGDAAIRINDDSTFDQKSTRTAASAVACECAVICYLKGCRSNCEACAATTSTARIQRQRGQPCFDRTSGSDASGQMAFGARCSLTRRPGVGHTCQRRCRKNRVVRRHGYERRNIAPAFSWPSGKQIGNGRRQCARAAHPSGIVGIAHHA